jgi:hypothetical protein
MNNVTRLAPAYDRHATNDDAIATACAFAQFSDGVA